MSSVQTEDTIDQAFLKDFDLCSDIDEYGEGNTTLSGIRDQEKNIPQHNVSGSGHITQFASETEYTSDMFVTLLKDELQQLKQDKDDLTQKLQDQKKTTSRKETELTAKTREHARLKDKCNQDKKYFEVTVGKYETKIEEQLKEIQRLRYFEGQHSVQNERIQELKKQLQQCKNSQTELTNKLHDDESDNKPKEEIILALGKENNSLKEEKLRDKKSFDDTVGKYETEREGLLKEIQRLFYFEDQYSIQKEHIRELNEQLAQSNNAQTELRNKLHRAECENKAKEEIIQALRKDKYSLEEEKNILLHRLSKMAGAKLTLDNPNIADLSDRKRPTKLAEEFAQLYDNEWTDAFEDVKNANEQKKTTFMLILLKRASEMCIEVSNEHMNGIKRSICTLTVHTNGPSGRTQPEQFKVSFDPSNLQDEQKKSIMELRKFIEISLSDQLEAVVADMIARENDIDKQTEIAVFNYIKKCVNICWSMCRVEPPVFINFPDEQIDLRLDTNVYKAYTKTGTFVDYIVWPAVYLHENGPVLCKGVAQGKA